MLNIVLVFLYLLGVFISPFLLDKIRPPQEDYEEFQEVVYPWIWPILLVIIFIVLILSIPDFIFKAIRGDFKNE